ncbi:hypothetical protein ALQ64_02832 [Pseudomonas cannabina]|uniref:Uncharacterized protein n=1 Tax=Pseudomonas cannabina TaxID=86840 RepID=A0A3M3KDS6_PSECA|nr:hypothetical protein ALQ64_02832 [Pseudomonas cannabina]
MNQATVTPDRMLVSKDVFESRRSILLTNARLKGQNVRVHRYDCESYTGPNIVRPGCAYGEGEDLIFKEKQKDGTHAYFVRKV